MSIVERGADRLYLEKPRDHEGHCDRGDAFSLAIVSVFHAALAKLTPQPMEGPVRVVLAQSKQELSGSSTGTLPTRRASV